MAEQSRTLYHGSTVIVEYPEIRTARFNKDFYFGFYCTMLPAQAERWAVRYTGKGMISEYLYTPDPELRVKVFPEMTEEWLDFIADCRLGKSHDYDIVEGPMANDTIFNYVQNFVDGKISRAAFWELAKFKHPKHQISFHTARALMTLQFQKGYEVIDEKNDSALFFLCSLIEFIGRRQKRRRGEVVDALGDETLRRIYTYADTLHCEPMDQVADRFISLCDIHEGEYDNVLACRYEVPDYWTIGEVYERLIEDVSGEDVVRTLRDVYASWIDEKISDYNTDFYYQSREYLRECYLAGEVL